MRVVQITPGGEFDNPVRDEAELFHRFFRSWGWESAVLTPDESELPITAIDTESLLFYHVQVALPLDSLIDHPPERTIVVLHELIPAKPLDHFEPKLMTRLAKVRDRLQELAAGCPLALGHSRHACDDLQTLGFQRIRHLPPAVDFESMDRPADSFTGALLEGDTVNLLYAGDLYPTCGAEHLLKTAWYFNSFLAESLETAYPEIADSDYRRSLKLTITGRLDACPGYFATLIDVAGEYRLDQNSLVFTGPLTSSQLRAHFRAADIYLHLSGSDAAGARLLQAIHFGVPVVALARAAAPEILGDAGVLLDSTIHSAAAEVIHRLLADGEWRSLVVARQKARLEHYSHEAIAFQLRSLLSRFGR
jgi:glycosyltransferase involved in cell wall biosynthesis